MWRRTASRFFLTSALIAGASFQGCSRSRLEYRVVFTDTLHLKRGSQVFYAGVPIGKLEAISLRNSATGAPSQVVVTIALKPGNYQVREGDRFEVSSEGLLGESCINISPVLYTGSPLPAGATIQGETPGLQDASFKGLSLVSSTSWHSLRSSTLYPNRNARRFLRRYIALWTRQSKRALRATLVAHQRKRIDRSHPGHRLGLSELPSSTEGTEKRGC